MKIELVHLPTWLSTCRETSKILGLIQYTVLWRESLASSQMYNTPCLKTCNTASAFQWHLGKGVRFWRKDWRKLNALPSSADCPEAASHFCLIEGNTSRLTSNSTQSYGINTPHGRWNLHTSRQWDSLNLLTQSPHRIERNYSPLLPLPLWAEVGGCYNDIILALNQHGNLPAPWGLQQSL